MRLHDYIFLFLCLGSVGKILAQNFSNSDSTSKSRARQVVSFSSADHEMGLIVFSPVSDTRYLVLKEDQQSFHEIYIEYGIDESIPKIVKKQDILFEEDPSYTSFFDKNFYCEGFIKSDSEFFKNYKEDEIKSIGEAAYFGYYEGINNICETILPIVVSPMPISEAVYLYVVARFNSHNW